MLHASFANTSPDLRVSLTFGFHRRSSVLGAKAALAVESDEVYGEERIFERSAVIAVAISARSQAFPNETPFEYQPLADRIDEFEHGPRTFERYIKDYNTKDLSI